MPLRSLSFILKFLFSIDLKKKRKKKTVCGCGQNSTCTVDQLAAQPVVDVFKQYRRVLISYLNGTFRYLDYQKCGIKQE
jgi:hypothetical protein